MLPHFDGKFRVIGVFSGKKKVLATYDFKGGAMHEFIMGMKIANSNRPKGTPPLFERIFIEKNNREGFCKGCYEELGEECGKDK